MKKIISLLFIAIISLSAGTVNEGQNDPRLYGKLFFDYSIGGQTYFEYVLAGNRKYMVLDNRIVTHLTAATSSITLSIKGRVEVPEHIESDTVILKTPVIKADLGDWNYIYINDKKITAHQTVFKVQTDSNGNRFLKLEIRGTTKGKHISAYLVKNLPKFTMSIAPAKKKRGKDFQWERPRLYVIDE